MDNFDHIWYWKSRLPARKNHLCRVVARGAKNSVLVEFPDGFKTVTSRYAVRKREPSLKETFKKVLYVVETGGQDFALEIGKNNVSFENFLKEHSFKSWAFITPCNPQAQQVSNGENEKLLKEFFTVIGGQKFFKAHTETPGALWPDEHGACIFDISLCQALKIARQFRQRAIVFGEIFSAPRLVFC